MKRIFFLSILILSILLTACGAGEATQAATETPPVATSTPDPCSSENLPAEIGRVNKLMREFDDYSALASDTPQAQLIQIIPDLQHVLRNAEDQRVPVCLIDLKKLQLAHMNMFIQTLIFLYGHLISPTSPDQEVVNLISTGNARARNLHGQYNIEMARLLGITLVPPPTLTPGAATPQVNAAPASPVSVPTITVTNLGSGAVNLRSAPDLNAPEAGLLGAQISTTALGKTADDLWIQVQIPDKPGQFAWVFAPLVQLSVPISSLPVITP